MNSRTKLASLVVFLSSAPLAGCATSGQSTLGVSGGYAPPPVSGANAPYFLDFQQVSVERDYVDRYVCRNGIPLQCRCESSRFGRCLCGCQ